MQPKVGLNVQNSLVSVGVGSHTVRISEYEDRVNILTRTCLSGSISISP